MNIQVVLQIIFPGMFFSPNDQIGICRYNAFLAHVLLVKPLLLCGTLMVACTEVNKIYAQLSSYISKNSPFFSIVDTSGIINNGIWLKPKAKSRSIFRIDSSTASGSTSNVYLISDQYTPVSKHSTCPPTYVSSSNKCPL